MKFSIIIVSWNTQELTLKCLKSIFNYVKNEEYEIFLVDNNSKDKTLELAHEISHEMNINNLHIIENKKNVGFATANNQGIKKARGDYVLLLNPDTELIDDSLLKMIEFADRNQHIGIVGPQLLNTNGSLQRSCRRFPKLSDQLFIQFKFYNLMPKKIKATREYMMLDFNHESIKEVDQIMGAAMLIKKQVFDKIGLLDEKFWAVFEEVDFCKRTKDAGYKIMFYPDCQIMHHKEQSFKQMASLKKQMNFNHSLYHYFRKYKPGWQLFILWLVQPFNLLLTWVDESLGIRKIFGKQKDL